jgi:hypothetical protein
MAVASSTTTERSAPRSRAVEHRAARRRLNVLCVELDVPYL